MSCNTYFVLPHANVVGKVTSVLYLHHAIRLQLYDPLKYSQPSQLYEYSVCIKMLYLRQCKLNGLNIIIIKKSTAGHRPPPKLGVLDHNSPHCSGLVRVRCGRAPGSCSLVSRCTTHRKGSFVFFSQQPDSIILTQVTCSYSYNLELNPLTL